MTHKKNAGLDAITRRTFLVSPALITARRAAGAAPEEPSGNEVIWFRYPGTDWNTQALHLGNGYFGASVIGDIRQERFALGEKSFWTGGPVDSKGGRYGIVPGGKDAIQEVRRLILAGQIQEADALARQHMMGNYSSFGSLTTVGNLLFDFDDHDGAGAEYLRLLDLRRAVAAITYRLGGTRYRRVYFCSYPARALVMRFSCDRPGMLGFRVQFDPAHRNYAPAIESSARTGRWALLGEIDDNRLRYQVRMLVRHQGGRLVQDGDTLRMSGAREATVIYTVATEYRMEPPSYRGENPEVITSGVLERLQNRGYSELLVEHVADYQRLYQQTSFRLGGGVPTRETLPTDQRWDAYSKGDFADVGLKEMAFHFGKYLLISASRPGALPSGIQGPWANALTSPWSGNYQININVQLIYMPCGVLGLNECQEPFLEWIRSLVVPGREVARAYYGTEGWVQHTTGNIWGYASPGATLDWGIFLSGAAWNCRHVWEQYEFTQDRAYLRDKAYPLMKEAAEFYLANLVEYKGSLVPAPAISAEHQSSLGYLEPPFQDVQMVGDLFANVVQAAKILNADVEFRQRVSDARERMMALRIGRLGQLQEWVADIDDPNCRHRHFMHLYAVHPGHQINPLTMPELAAAARVSMNLRGDGNNAERLDPKYTRNTWVCSCRHNGSPIDGAMGGNWSRAWKIWIWARLLDGNRADKIFSELIGEAGNENLTTYQQRGRANDTRSKPMQLDGSVSTPGFIAETLLQSQWGELHLLPALPTTWPSGNITGLVARGGYRVDLRWDRGQLVSAAITVPKTAGAPAVRVASELIDPSQDRRIQFLYSRV